MSARCGRRQQQAFVVQRILQCIVSAFLRACSRPFKSPEGSLEQVVIARGGMWGHAPFVPDSEEEFRIVYDYGDGGGLVAEEEAGAQEAGARGRRGGRPRYVRATSAAEHSDTNNTAAPAAELGTHGPRATQQQQQQPSPAASGGRPAHSGGGADGGGPRPGQQQPAPTLAQELQSVLHGLTQQPPGQQHGLSPHGAWGEPERGVVEQQQQKQQPAAQQQQQQLEAGAWRPRREGVRRINTTSPAVPPESQPSPSIGGHGPASGGRRWRRRAQSGTVARAAPGPLQRPPPAAPVGESAPQQARGAAVGGAAASASVGGGGGDDFFSVDADLLQAHAQQHQARQQGRRVPGQRSVQWNSPQVGAAAGGLGGEQTPLQPSQRANPLAALLGSAYTAGGAAAKQRPATTGGKVQRRHPIYGHAAPASSLASQPSVAAAPNSVGGSRLRELSQREPPLTSPCQAQQRRPPQQHQQQQHSRFAIRDAASAPAASTAARVAGFAGGQPFEAPAAAAAAAAAAGTAGTMQAAAGLRQLTGEQPGSALRQHSFHPRRRRPPSPGDNIVDEEEGLEAGGNNAPHSASAWGQHPAHQQLQQQQQQQPEAALQDQEAGAAADSFRTPGQPLRRSWQDAEEQQQQHPQQHLQEQFNAVCPAGADAAPPAAAAATARPGTGGGDRSSRRTGPAAAAANANPLSAGRGGAGGAGGGGLALQRQFIAQLQPVSSSAAAATMQQQRQRLAGAAGLHARMQAILAAEKAGLEQSPGGGGGRPRLTVLQKEFEGSITKCLCRCDSAAEAALHAPEVIALLQSRTAQQVDTTPGSVILLQEPWRVMPLAGSAAPAVLCYAASMG